MGGAPFVSCLNLHISGLACSRPWPRVAGGNVVIGHRFLTHQFEEFIHLSLWGKKKKDLVLICLHLCSPLLSPPREAP